MMAFSPSAPIPARQTRWLWELRGSTEFGGPVNTGDGEACFVEIEEGGGSLDKNKSSAVYHSEEWD